MGVQFGPSSVDFAEDDWQFRADGSTLYVENKNTGETYAFVNSPDAGDDIARIGDVQAAGGVDFTQGKGPMALPWHMTEYAQGLNNTEIGRMELESGKQLEVWRLETRFQGGGSNPDFTIDLYDSDTSSVLASTSNRSTGGSSPLGTSSEGATILLRITNNTSGSRTASISGIMNLTEV